APLPGLVRPGHFGATLEMFFFPGQLEFQNHCLARLQRRDTLKTDTPFTQIDEDGAIIRTQIYICESVDPTTPVGPSLDWRVRRNGLCKGWHNCDLAIPSSQKRTAR